MDRRAEFRWGLNFKQRFERVASRWQVQRQVTQWHSNIGGSSLCESRKHGVGLRLNRSSFENYSVPHWFVYCKVPSSLGFLDEVVHSAWDPFDCWFWRPFHNWRMNKRPCLKGNPLDLSHADNGISNVPSPAPNTSWKPIEQRGVPLLVIPAGGSFSFRGFSGIIYSPLSHAILPVSLIEWASCCSLLNIKLYSTNVSR